MSKEIDAKSFCEAMPGYAETPRGAKGGHTPGPLEAWDDDGTGTLPCVLSKHVNAGGNFYTAQCNVYADAVLYAAAPDLLAVCEKLLARECIYADLKCIKAAARAAIAKAVRHETA